MPTPAELIAELKTIEEDAVTLRARRADIVRALNVSVGPFAVNIIEETISVGGQHFKLSSVPSASVRKLAKSLNMVADQMDIVPPPPPPPPEPEPPPPEPEPEL